MPHGALPPSKWKLSHSQIAKGDILQETPSHWLRDSYFAWDLKDNEFSRKKLSSHSGQDYCIYKLISTLEIEFSHEPHLFLDIGANDGLTNSSTFFLEIQGWKGILIEPNVELNNTLLSRKNSIVINTAISDVSGIGILSTSNKAHMLGTLIEDPNSFSIQVLNCAVNYFNENEFKKIPVSVISTKIIMEFFLKQFGMPPNFLKIDVEGKEHNIVKSLVSSGIYPDFIEIENNLRESLCDQYLSNIGYKCIIVIDAHIEIWSFHDIKKESILSIFY
tara:strand:+ start:1510 stop:2337 length:828 start_codon:yes stop_codon:yes gene_type:complete